MSKMNEIEARLYLPMTDTSHDALTMALNAMDADCEWLIARVRKLETALLNIKISDVSNAVARQLADDALKED